MIEHKRSPISIDQSSHTTFAPKRHKADLSISSKETKEKLGEKIAALQQLVSPYGKTDTASVLLEAMEYITFLHEQVTVLSAPYLQSIPTANMQIEKNETRNNAYAIGAKSNHTVFGAKAYVWCQFHGPAALIAATVQISGLPSRPPLPNIRPAALVQSLVQSTGCHLGWLDFGC
ncbi:hypothetical protein RHGRI_004113 [Rhododendron griersonianum]|uniref:BHLH domain-containing protein n=1 Tax=Rhododendron griersonianum TaxID=479676 RepID=A0AAV6L7P7_9ERIC|nr:hypothetical protein RHGRI_004113 [Rhododendron griersonianum]